MNLLDRILGRTPKPADKRTSDAELLAMLAGGNRSSSGANVTAENAMTFTAVLACVRVLSESVASLPLITYRRDPDGGKSRATDHPLYTVLHDAPNPDMTSVQWRETAMVHLCLWGNSYNEIVFDGAGRVRELWPLNPRDMTVKRVNDRLVYEYREGGQRLITYGARNILHICGLSMNGLVGLSPIAIARDAIGLGMTLNEYGGRVFANGARPSGVLEHPGQLGDEAYKRLKESFEHEYAGAGNAGKTLLLEEGTKFTQTSFPPEDAQFLQSRKFQIEEVSRIFRVPLHKIGVMDHATFGNIEHQSLEFVVDCLRPYLVRWEQAISAKLLSDRERATYFSEHLVDGLLRGDITSRYAAYAVGRQWGWLNVNEIRSRENMNPIDGGSAYLEPLNMVEVGKDESEPTEEGARDLLPQLELMLLRHADRTVAAQQPPNVSINVPPVEVHFDRELHIPAPIVNMTVEPTPVTILNEQRAGEVIVNVPQQPAPVVNVSVPAQPAPIVHVNMPEPQPVGFKLNYNRNGDIDSIEPEQM